MKRVPGSVWVILLAAVLVGAYFFLAQFMREDSPGDDGPRSFELVIGAPVGEEVPIWRVGVGQQVTLTVRRVERAATLHVHALGVEKALVPGRDEEVSFLARIAGRFPVEIHPDGDDEGDIVAYVEARP